ncbi:MAG TPA: hypothetical protein G4O11_09210 [Anaerolineae bacterium]|nr:hypothetical protein [Anaerolineae bacterium]
MTSVEYRELVTVVPLTCGKLPLEFTWRGRRHRVRSVESFHTETKSHRNGVIQRRFFRLRTASGMRCLLSQEVERETWHLEKVLINQGGVR